MMRRQLVSTQNEFDQIKKILARGSRDRSYVVPYGLEYDLVESDGIDHVYWRAYEHCATLVRAYATFEQFVLKTIEQWIGWCFSNKPDYLLQSAKAKGAYEAGMAEILRRKTEARFSDLDLGKIARGLASFYSGTLPAGYTLPVDPYFSNLPNLRLRTIHSLFASVELDDLIKWIEGSARLRKFCNDEGFGIEEELTQLVLRRNEAAHGSELPGEILGTNDLISRLNFLSMLCEVIYEFTIASICKLSLGPNYGLGLIGRVTSLWPRHSAFELTMSSNVIATSMPVMLISQGCLVANVIESLMWEDDRGIGFEVPVGTPLGVGMNYMPAIGMDMINYSPIQGLEELISGAP